MKKKYWVHYYKDFGNTYEAATVSTMEIETDGDCDSAFVTTLGREYFMGANGYEVE